MGQPTFLGDQTWTETAPSTLVIPIGSTEQHGPHLPVDTDTRIAIAVSEGAAAVIDTVAITPPIAITASGEHDGFPGTLSIGSDVMVRVLVELVRSTRWAPRVVLVNGHGGNHRAVTEAVALLTSEGDAVSAWWPSDVGDITGADPGDDLHAGSAETSVMLHLDATRVRSDAMAPGPSIAISELQADGVALHSPSGVLGDPTRADAALGQAILSRWIDSLVEHLRRVS